MNFFLSPSTVADLAQALESTTSKGRGQRMIIRNPIDRRCVTLYLAPEPGKVLVGISLEGERHTIRLQAADPANAQHLREQIEAIANGTADTAETGAIGTPSAPAREPFALCEDDEASLRHLVRIGGTRHLHCGASITVHNALQSTQRHAWVTTPNGTSPLQAGTPGELYVAAAQHIEAALNAA
ncbi:MAG: hypothetical protein ACN6P1_05435 [Pseudomonas sp.]|uniref:hypothetical protein n=1 Tax=Pseudomonas sp. TaxID=306 RepID=UPI003D150CD6